MTRANKRITSMGTVGTFLNGRACSDTLAHVLNSAFDQPMAPEERAAQQFAGGIIQHGYQCGMIWGAALAAGAQAHRLLGSGPRAEAAAIKAAQRLVESFREGNKHINCLEITDLDQSSSTWQMVFYFLVKGGSIGCFRRAARYAPVAYREIDAALSGDQGEVPDGPASCAAVLAQRMGASEMQVMMAAGLAGGIGLCGGACGALGAAIWLKKMRDNEKSAKKMGFKDPGALALIDRFLKCTEYKFECSEIVGRRFESVGDHAEHLRGGGCAEILEVLAR